jgi:hypothetical protein
MNTECITLSPEHSARLHALHHIAGFLSMDELIHELIFTFSPDNTLDCIKDGLDPGPEQRRIEALLFPVKEDDRINNWDDLIQRASNAPAFDPGDYPDPQPRNVVELAPHLHLVK